MEKELFRYNLERLDKVFPNKEMISRKEFKGFLGVKDIRTIAEYFPPNKTYETKVKLARALS